MRNILIVVIIIALAVLIYKAYHSGAFDRSGDPNAPQKAVHGVVKAGEDLGRNTSKALDKVRLPGS